MNPIFQGLMGWRVRPTPTNQKIISFCKIKKPSVWLIRRWLNGIKSINQKSIKVGLDKNQHLQNQPWLIFFCFDWFLFVATLNTNPLNPPFFFQTRIPIFFCHLFFQQKMYEGIFSEFSQQQKHPSLKLTARTFAPENGCFGRRSFRFLFGSFRPIFKGYVPVSFRECTGWGSIPWWIPCQIRWSPKSALNSTPGWQVKGMDGDLWMEFCGWWWWWCCCYKIKRALMVF